MVHRREMCSAQQADDVDRITCMGKRKSSLGESQGTRPQDLPSSQRAVHNAFLVPRTLSTVLTSLQPISGMPSITVVGGGISGLSAAFHLARRFPAATGARITLVEKAQRLGGWVRAERVRVADGHGRKAEILLESGPRTLRPNSKAILELVSPSNLCFGFRRTFLF